MKKIVIICLLIGLFRVSYSQLPKKRYFEQSAELINKYSPGENYIKIFMVNGSEYEGRFVAYQGQYITFISYSTGDELRIPLSDIRRICSKKNLSVYDKKGFEKLFGGTESVYSDSLLIVPQEKTETITVADTQEKLENITEQSLNERQTVALEKIALAQTYFMIYSIVVTLVSILLIIAWTKVFNIYIELETRWKL